MNISFKRSLFLGLLVRFLIMAFVAKIISLSVLFFLPKEGIQSSVKTQFVMPYMRYSIDGFRLKVSDIKAAEEANSLSIDSIILKAIYMMGKESIIVVAPKAKAEKSKTIGIGEVFETYTLEKVYNDYVIFSKNAKQYRLYLIEPKPSSRLKSAVTETGDVLHRVPSDEVKKMISNPAEIWKSIGLQPHLSGGKPDGFQVSFVKRGTVFESLGLRTGDVIQSINNKEIRNNAQAFGAYQEFKDAKAIKVTIQRGKETMELEYEIF